MGTAYDAGWLHAFGSGDYMPELLNVMENGSREQSADAAHSLFEQLCSDGNEMDIAVCGLIHPLIDILSVQNKSVAKATILNGIAQVLRLTATCRLPFGVTPNARIRDAAGEDEAEQLAGRWLAALRDRFAEWTALLYEDEQTAIQAIYVIHLMQDAAPEAEDMLLHASLHGEWQRVRLNGLIALADCRRRLHKPFNPSLALGQHRDDVREEAVRSICMALAGQEPLGRNEWEQLIQGCALPRLDRIQFPWADGAISSVCAQAACLALARSASREERAEFWMKALERTIQAHRQRSRQVVWEIGASTVQWDEEWLQWNWNGPMLVADGMLSSLFAGIRDAETGIEPENEPPVVAKVIKLCLQYQVEMPNAGRYGASRLIRSLYRYLT
ncbi:hypothetical protein QJQ58_24575 [Paenibacillus dendritiformis]|uniref:hypothetical protein n=1 Tax=Paenibacillus dendritiformis TaxID=130049 RepID=UPI00248B3FF8|nr:hypothetical protein [Paenibacillus dendritiformis]WGU93675.1 hypothetical protein QJQ58_24575 [Paenibacillus dendritiformis]